MAFQRLNIRAKKSFSGLCSFDNTDSCRSPANTATSCESPSPSVLPKNDVEYCDLAEFGSTLERCKGQGTPEKDSPSRRKKLLGSLRSLRSLRNLHSPSKPQQIEMPRPQSPFKRQDSCVTPTPMSPSLALNFEQSLPDQPIFELNMHQRSTSGSSLEVQHSSPVTVPGSARQTNPYNLVLSSTDLPFGTIPDTPGPLQRAFERDPANHVPWQNASPTPMERNVPSAPVLTPLPGTNLPFEDSNPALVALPPSVTSLQNDQQSPGYFDIPVDEQSQMDKTDVLNGLACLKLAAGHEVDVDDRSETSHGTTEHTQAVDHGLDQAMRREYEASKLQDVLGMQDSSHPYTRALRRKQQARDLHDGVCPLDIPQHHQTLPLRLKQQDEDLQERVRKDSVISEDWDTSSGQPTTSDRTYQRRNQNLSHEAENPVSASAFTSPTGEYNGAGDKSSPTANLAYIVWDSPSETRQRAPPENIWRQHAGLYDGTGYGDDGALPATPQEPDEGTKSVHMQLSPRSVKVSPALSVEGGHSENDVFTRQTKCEDAYPEHARESPLLTTGERGDHESFESIYHAYAYPFGERVPSGSSNTSENVQLPVTQTTDIRP